jgi:hypothetical protein
MSPRDRSGRPSGRVRPCRARPVPEDQFCLLTEMWRSDLGRSRGRRPGGPRGAACTQCEAMMTSQPGGASLQRDAGACLSVNVFAPPRSSRSQVL